MRDSVLNAVTLWMKNQNQLRAPSAGWRISPAHPTATSAGRSYKLGVRRRAKGHRKFEISNLRFEIFIAALRQYHNKHVRYPGN
jgi:hypothetical protein